MSTALIPVPPQSLTPAVERPLRALPVPWRDPHSVSPVELRQYISELERGCEEHPRSADLRTCLGVAYAMNYQVYKSMDSLETARRLDKTHFFAQFKYAELLYRLRALPRAEEESSKAIALAGNWWELSIARSQLQQIRERIREGTQKPEWNRPLKRPTLALVTLFAILSTIAVIFK
jgi:hypothetical protein